MRLFSIIVLLSIQTTVYCQVTDCYLSPDPVPTISEIVEQCRGKQHIWGSYHQFKLEKMSQMEVDVLFTDTLEMDINFEITGSTAKRMIFPKLKQYVFDAAPPSTTTSFHHNNQLEVIAFLRVQWIRAEQGNMTFSHNPKLREIQLPNLEYFILHDGNLMIADNAELQSIAMKNLAVTKFSNLIIRNNPELQAIVLECTGHPIYPTYPILLVKDKVIIEENEFLETVSVRGKTPGKVVSIRRLEIRKNWRLERVEFEEFAEKSEMRIEGNPKLERATLERLAANLSWGRIQDYGECIMEEEIRQLAILDDCLYIYGHLVLAAGARGAVSGRLTRVEGRVYTADLTVDRLAFLLDTEIYGDFESDLCDFDYSRFKSAKKGVRKRCREEETTTRRKATTATRKRTEKPRTTTKKVATTTKKATTRKRTEKPTRRTTKRVTTAMITRRTTTRRGKSTESPKRTTTTVAITSLAGSMGTKTTEKATIGSTARGEEASTVTPDAIKEEMTTEDGESTETSTQLTPMTGNLRGNEGKGDNKRIVIISVVIVALILFAAAVSTAFFCRRKSKKKRERKGEKSKKEDSSNGSESSSNSSTRKSQTKTSRRNKD